MLVVSFFLLFLRTLAMGGKETITFHISWAQPSDNFENIRTKLSTHPSYAARLSSHSTLADFVYFNSNEIAKAANTTLRFEGNSTVVESLRNGPLIFPIVYGSSDLLLTNIWREYYVNFRNPKSDHLRRPEKFQVEFIRQTFVFCESTESSAAGLSQLILFLEPLDSFTLGLGTFLFCLTTAVLSWNIIGNPKQPSISLSDACMLFFLFSFLLYGMVARNWLAGLTNCCCLLSG